MWIRDGELGCARQAAAAIQNQRLCDAVREMEILGGSRAILETEHELCAAGPSRVEDERHRACAEDGPRENAVIETLQDRIAVRSEDGVRRRGGGRGNDEPVESVEKQKQLFPSSHAPLEISPKAGEIPTFPQPRVAPDGKVGKPQAGFPLSHAGRATKLRFLLFRNLTPKQETCCFAAASHFLGSPWKGMLIQIKKSLAAEVTDAVQQAQSWTRSVGRF